MHHGEVAAARAGDPEARQRLTRAAGLRAARAILGSAAEREGLLRAIARDDGPAPALPYLLAAIAIDDTGEVQRAAETVVRASTDRWGPPERAAIGAFAAATGARLGVDRALELVERIAQQPGELDDVVRGASAALADASAEVFEGVGWRTGFEHVVRHDREATIAWSARPAAAQAMARALFRSHARGGASAVPTLDALWTLTPAREVWAGALADATNQHRGMSGRADLVAWSWGRFCGAPPAEQRLLYRAFRPWRDEWFEARNATPRAARPGGQSAVAHLALWGGLDIELLSSVVDESARLATDADWAGLVDTTFDLAADAPTALRRHALAGATRIVSEVCNRVRAAAEPRGLEAGADRVLVRAAALVEALRESGAVLDRIVQNRVDDLETDLGLIKEARARRAPPPPASPAAEPRPISMLGADPAPSVTTGPMPAPHVTTRPTPAPILAPSVPITPLDTEVLAGDLALAPTLLAYARLFKRLTGGSDSMQRVLAEGVSMEAIGHVNQTWAATFAKRPELALRFSTLIGADWT